MHPADDKVHALKHAASVAEQTLRRSHELTGSPEADAGNTGIVFTGDFQHTAPNSLVLDPILSPTDKMTWIVMRSSIQSPQMPGSIPSRKKLAEGVNCSLPTITNSRNMLRICRWMTFSHQVRNQSNQFIGDVYLLHSEPLGIAETLEFDPSFLSFLEAMQSNSTSTKSVHDQASKVYQEILAFDRDPTPITQLQAINNRLVTARKLPTWDASSSASATDMGNGKPNTHSSHNPQAGSQVKNLDVGLTGNRSNIAQKTDDFAGRPTQIKNFDTATLPQSKNLDVGTVLNAKSRVKNLDVESPRGLQSDLGNLNANYSSPEQANNFLTSICSSTCSSSSNNNISRTREAASPFGNETDPKAKEWLISEGLVDPSCIDELSLDLQLNYLLDVERALRQHLPSLLGASLKPHYDVIWQYRHLLPIVGSLLRQLSAGQSAEISYQLFARLLLAKHPVQQYRADPVRNLVGFTKELIKRMKANEFALDDYGHMVKDALSKGMSLVVFDGKQLVDGVPLPSKLPLEV